MNRTIFAFVALAGLGACVESGDNAPLRIIGNVAPADNCIVDSGSNTFLPGGVIESGSLLGYVFTPSVRNDLQSIEGEPIGPKTIYVTHARVRISFYDPDFEDVTSDSSLLSFSVPTSGSIEPNGGLGAYRLEIAPRELLTLIGARLGAPTMENPIPRTVIDAQVQMFGSRGGGGGEEESNVFRYPIEVCVGCLSNDAGACQSLPTGFQARTGGACNVAQDGVTDCCDNFTVCPASEPSS